MISSIFMERLPVGALSYFDVPPDGPRTVFCLNAHYLPYEWDWEEHTCTTRMFVPVNIDTNLEEFRAGLSQWIASIANLPGDGTLMFLVQAQGHLMPPPIVRNPGQEPCLDRTGEILIAGLAYVQNDNFLEAVPLEGRDPVELILQLCDRDPAVQQFLEGPRRRREELHARSIEEERQADARALALLEGCLTPEQCRELADKQYFHVWAQNGQLFRIVMQKHQNVFRVEAGKLVEQFCIVPKGGQLPIFDVMLAQKLLLESDIETFMRVANRWGLENEERVRIRHPHMEQIYAEEDRRMLAYLNGAIEAAVA